MNHLAALLDVRLTAKTHGQALVWDAPLARWVLGGIVANLPIWTKYTIGYADLSAAGLTNNVTLFTLPAKTLIHAVVINPTQAFGGGLITAYTLSVGIAGTLTKYCTAASVFAATLQAPQMFMGLESMTQGTAIKVAATSVTGLLNAATTGSADIYALTSILP